MRDWKLTTRTERSHYKFSADKDVVVLTFSGDLKESTPSKSGGVRCVLPVEDYRGKRVRLNAEFSTNETDSAGLWLTASNSGWHLTDGMYDRLVSGSSPWKEEQLVIDVPADSEYLSFGLWMVGKGECTMKNARVEIVDASVPVTVDKFFDKVGMEKWQERI